MIKSNGRTFKYWSTVNGHAKDMCIFKKLEHLHLSQDLIEKESVDSSGDEIVDVSDNYEIDPFSKVINKFKWVCLYVIII